MKTVYRITTFVPSGRVKEVEQAIVEAGGACFGAYSEVFWRCEGTEQFRPMPGASPAAGTIGNLTVLPSTQLVFSIPKDGPLLERVVSALRSAHPWERPVIFIDETRTG